MTTACSPASKDVAQVFGNLAGRLNDTADGPGRRKAGLDRDPLALGLAPVAAQVHGRWMPGTSGVHGRSIRVISLVGSGYYGRSLSCWLGR